MSEEQETEKPKGSAEDKPVEKKSGAEPAAKPSPDKAPAAAKPAAAAAPEKSPEPPSEPGPFAKILSRQGISSKRLPDSCGVETIEIDGQDLEKTMLMLRKVPEPGLNYLVAVSGVDSPDTFDSVYHLRSYFNKDELVVKVRVPKSSVAEGQLPLVPSLAPVWQTADWHERETYDLVGIRYVGHPYLRRILNPWDWEGHPLRRDYKQVIDALNNKAPGSFR